jgi:outer membrane biosynthesis protein TonB
MLKNSLHGTVTYEWEINVDGSVNLVNVLRSELKSSVLETCVMQIIKDITFPKAKNGQRTKVIYPFLFQKT